MYHASSSDVFWKLSFVFLPVQYVIRKTSVARSTEASRSDFVYRWLELGTAYRVQTTERALLITTYRRRRKNYYYCRAQKNSIMTRGTANGTVLG